MVLEAKFKTQGCIPSIACASWLTERIRGKAVAELAGISAEEIAEALGGLPAASRHAAVLARDALQHVLEKVG
jgi:NifU-like protein involved in Fe-S cluster formation